MRKTLAALTFIDKEISGAEEMLEMLWKKKDGYSSFSAWCSWNLASVLLNEEVKRLWTIVKTNIEGGIQNGKTDEDIITFLQGMRDPPRISGYGFRELLLKEPLWLLFHY